MAITPYPLFTLFSFMMTHYNLAGASQPGPPGRQLGHYPSLPPGYQNTPASHGATAPMHPAMQAATQPYSQATPPYQQVRRKLVRCWLFAWSFLIHSFLACLWQLGLDIFYIVTILTPLLLISPLLAWWPGASSAQPFPGCHEPPVQHPRSPQSGQLAAGEEPVATNPDPCPHTLPPSGPAESQLSPRVSYGCFVVIIL